MEDPSQHIEIENEPVDFNLLESPILSAHEDGDPKNIEDITSTAGATSVTSKDPLDHAYEKKTRKKTSVFWRDFSVIELPSGEKKSQCNWCKALLTLSRSSSTSTMRRHRDTCLSRVVSNKKQKTLSIESKENDDVVTIGNFTYDHKKVRELLSHMILYHEYPFNIVEHVLFNKFMKANTPHWQKISRATARNDCIDTYQIEKRKLKTLLNGVDKVNITTDMWTSGQKVSYMVVTCHFVDLDWLLQKRVLNFCNVPPPHSGFIIADTLQKCFVDWGIENKVFTVTVDNAKANDVAVRILKDDFRLRKLLAVGGKLFHVRCCAHVTNLLVQDGLGQIGNIIDCVREGIKYLVASEGRLRQFSEITKQLQLPSKKLILDVPTRWNSTYLMLVTAMEFKEVFPRFQDRDQNFQWVPTFEDWMKVKNICDILEVFNEVTNIVSGSVYPTSNLFLPEVWRMKEVLTAKSVDRNEYIQAMTKKMNEKFEKYWGECNLLMAIAAVLDPRYKMVLIKFCFPLIYLESETSQNIDLVFKVLHELYDEYVQVHNSKAMSQTTQKNINVSSSSSSTNMFARTMPSGRSMFQSFVRNVDNFQPIKSDLDVYLEEGVYICEEGTDAKFDALEWWKVNNLKYKILSKMARDILAIPISTVASESTFSAGGRVIDPYRASLSTKTVQILLCGADWVRARHGLKKELKEELELAEIVLP